MDGMEHSARVFGTGAMKTTSVLECGWQVHLRAGGASSLQRARSLACCQCYVHGFKLRPLTFQYEFVALFSKIIIARYF